MTGFYMMVFIKKYFEIDCNTILFAAIQSKLHFDQLQSFLFFKTGLHEIKIISIYNFSLNILKCFNNFI